MRTECVEFTPGQHPWMDTYLWDYLWQRPLELIKDTNIIKSVIHLLSSNMI